MGNAALPIPLRPDRTLPDQLYVVIPPLRPRSAQGRHPRPTGKDVYESYPERDAGAMYA